MAAALRPLFRVASIGPAARSSFLLQQQLLSGVGIQCHCKVMRNVSSRRKTDHLERTINNFRQEMIAEAKVCGIVYESETVKRLRLVVMNKDFAFKAGQWVDFFIPGISKVGGFSICSSPGLLERESVVELAVKYSKHPPAHWIHTQCNIGSEVTLRVGGDFFFDPRPSDSPVDLLLVAGGVGINPLYSILLHIADLHRLQETKHCNYKPGSVQLYFSAKNTEELLFKRNIINLAKEFSGKISCHFHVTQQSSEEIPEELLPYVTVGRISEDTLAHVSKDNLCYICGPPPMIESVSQQLEKLGVPKENIIFEKWW
ncbi:oxidoreductase NAD-binding domain-containing protein 1 [Pristis pectinata]|uniref:oxidoreductase NAD-binding domain-containing protein 1 n=1 Tax=Pristis pectinata TaxID=685728 RepID=UPI00223E217C|nr:oxidoreductase NAD-binding domain-containing protein 1 [Pristis pectinata]